MHDESSEPRRARTTVDGLRVLIEGTHARLDGPTHWPLGHVERVAESKAPQWTARAEDGRVRTERSRQLALQWLLDATADERAVKDAEAGAQQAELDAEAKRQAAETAQATRAVTDLIRTVRPAYTGPTRLPFTDSSVFMFSPSEIHDLLTKLVAPGPRVLPTAEAVKHLDQRSVVLCHVSNATPEDPIPDIHPYLWGFLIDAVAFDHGDDDSVAITFAFEGNRADEFNEIQLPRFDTTAMVTRDAVTFVDQEGGFLLALTPEEGTRWRSPDSTAPTASGGPISAIGPSQSPTAQSRRSGARDSKTLKRRVTRQRRRTPTARTTRRPTTSPDDARAVLSSRSTTPLNGDRPRVIHPVRSAHVIPGMQAEAALEVATLVGRSVPGCLTFV
jgi:hypothetical protein